MMLAALLLLQAAPAPAADEVVVIGERLEKNWAAKFRSGAKGMQCKVTRSTGDAEIDRIGCVAMEACTPIFQSRTAATDQRGIRPEVKKMMQTSLNAEFTNCVKRERTAGIAALVAQRKVQ